MKNLTVIHVIAVAFEKFGQMKVFVQSWINQGSDNWILTVIHDGPNDEFELIMAEYKRQAPSRIFFECTEKRYNDYGHTLRDFGLKNILGDYVLLSNADNYFIPRAVEFMNQAMIVQDADVILFDMIHSHERPGGRNLPAYSFFETSYAPGSIDVSAALVKAELASAVGFPDKGHDGDATYFLRINSFKSPKNLIITKMLRVLFVHN